MNKSLALIPVVFAIFALMVSPAIMSASADPESSNGNGSENAHPNDCVNSQGKAAQKNPNCEDDGGTDPPTGVDCSYSEDGIITAEELLFVVDPTGTEHNISQVQSWISQAEASVGGQDNTVIDSDKELLALNEILAEEDHEPCY